MKYQSSIFHVFAIILIIIDKIMDQISLKIKLVTLRMRKINIHSHYFIDLRRDNKAIDQKYFNIRSGLLEENISLICQLNYQQLNSELSLWLMEKTQQNTIKLGQITFTTQIINKKGLQTFNIFDQGQHIALFEAFFLILPVLMNTPVDLTKKNCQQQLSHPYIQQSSSLSFHKKGISEIRYEQQRQFTSIGTQTCGYDELFTLNKILEGDCLRLLMQNKQLKSQIRFFENQKLFLSQRINQLDETFQIYQSSDCQKEQLIQQLYNQIKTLKLQKYELLLEIEEMKKIEAFKKDLNIIRKSSRFTSCLSQQKSSSSSNLRQVEVITLDADSYVEGVSIQNEGSNLFLHNRDENIKRHHQQKYLQRRGVGTCPMLI